MEHAASRRARRGVYVCWYNSSQAPPFSSGLSLTLSQHGTLRTFLTRTQQNFAPLLGDKQAAEYGSAWNTSRLFNPKTIDAQSPTGRKKLLN